MKRFLSDKRALFLTIFLALLFLASVAFILFPRTDAKKTYVADVYQDGVLLRSIPLTEDNNCTFTVEGSQGESNVIEVRSGSIAVISASCPDKLCVHQGFRSDSLLPITCLPNRVVIRIRPASGEGENDAITY